jgi:hypothetical protein
MKPYRFQSFRDRNRPLPWFIQSALGILLVHSVFLQPANAQGVELDSSCQKPALNSRCQAHQLAQQPTEPVQKPTAPQVIKFKLNDLTGVSEWIRAEVTGNQVKLLHTVVAQSGLSKAISSAAMLPIAIGHTWYDHPTSQVVFQPDGCEQSDCLVKGINSVTLPAGTDFYQGRFTLEYTESGWLRTITFKLPH